MLRKTYLVIVALLSLHLIVPAQTVTLQGNLIGLTENQLQFVYNTSEGYKVDTIHVTDGKFTWSKKLSGPRKAMLFLPENSFPFFIEPGNIRIEGKPDSVVVIGSKTYDESIAYSRSFKDLQQHFTVLGVSLDDNIELWKNAIKEDKMPWTMVSDLKGLKNEVSSYFGIFGIPRSLLIDAEGKIIAKDLRGDELKQKLDELFSSN